MVFGPVVGDLFFVFAALAIDARLNVNDQCAVIRAALGTHPVRHLQFFAL